MSRVAGSFLNVSEHVPHCPLTGLSAPPWPGLPASTAAAREATPRACRTLRLLHHGREVHDVALLPRPPSPGGGPGQLAELAVVTAGEDGSVRSVLCGSNAAGQQVLAVFLRIAGPLPLPDSAMCLED